MSFNPLCARSVIAALPHLPDEPSVLELGNQSFSVIDKTLHLFVAELRANGRQAAADRLRAFADVPLGEERKRLTEPFYRALGFRDYAAIDVNTKYGSVVMDLNRDLAADYDFHATFDLVTNLGTGEHVFDQRRVFENIHNLTKPGGLMLHVMPFVNWINHGFYNFNPVLYADLAAANDYGILRLGVANKGGFEVTADPERAPQRATSSVPSWVARSARAARAYRGLRRVVARAPSPNGLGLTDALAEIPLSPAAPDLPLPRALEAVMNRDRVYTESDYPVLGNVSVVALLQKRHDRAFTIPMAGRYLDDIESDSLKAEYAGQHGADASGSEH